MLNICEKYARKYDILFNATKSQLLYFGKDSNKDNVQPVLIMDNGKEIPYVTKCLHLGNSISTTVYYLVELLDILCIIVTPLLVKMLGILCINIRLYMIIGLLIFLIYLTQLIVIFKIPHSWMIFV